MFQQHAGRRIVLATNVAETSLTVPGIRYVIDPGTARISHYSWRTKVQRLPIEPVSQASANQRKGRCGRVADGICIRLYSEEDFNGRPAFTDPGSCAPIWPPSSCRCWRSALATWRRSLCRATRVAPYQGWPDPAQELEAVRELPATGDREAKLQLTETGRQLSRIPLIRVWRRW